MDTRGSTLQRDFDRWLIEFGDDFPENVVGTVSIQEILRAHYLLCEHFERETESIALAGPRDRHLLPSAVGRQHTQYGGTPKYADPVDIAATLFYGLIKNHPFHDGNKRTAFLVAVFQLAKTNRLLISKHKLWDELAVRTAEGSLTSYSFYQKYRDDPDSDIRCIGEFFRRNTRRSDRGFYVITYAQLKRILQTFDYDLDIAAGNFIHVMKQHEVVTGKLFRRTRNLEWRTILKIGFPGWTSEVSRRDLQEVRRATGLTPDRGVDSMVFFKGADPIEALIPKYRGILARLRDK
jgi:prophage maintenance system killer protein